MFAHVHELIKLVTEAKHVMTETPYFCNLPARRRLYIGKFPHPIWSLYWCAICILSDVSWWARSQTFVFWTIRRLCTSVGHCYETGNVRKPTFWNPQCRTQLFLCYFAVIIFSISTVRKPSVYCNESFFIFRYGYWRSQLTILQTKISIKTGKVRVWPLRSSGVLWNIHLYWTNTDCHENHKFHTKVHYKAKCRVC